MGVRSTLRHLVPRSIRGRLLVGLVGLVVTVMLVGGVVMWVALDDYLIWRRDDQLIAYRDRAASIAIVPGDRTIGQRQIAALAPRDSTLVILDRSGDVLVAQNLTNDEIASVATASGRTEPTTVALPTRDLRVIGVDTPNLSVGDGDATVAAGSLVLGLDLTEDRELTRHFRLVGLAVVLVATATVALGTALVVRTGLRPLQTMTDSAAAIAAGSTDERLPTTGASKEAEVLAATVNRAFDERAAAEAALRDFIADAAHELRTPLTVINGWADLAMQSGLDDTDSAELAVERISAEATRMRMLVDELLLLARLDARQPLDKLPVDVTAIAEEVCTDAAIVAPDHEISVTAADHIVVTGDDLRLRQVFRNLVGNAVQHTPPGTHVGVAVSDGDPVVIRVIDDGPGLTDDQRAHVFDRFHRAGRAEGGSGLGLAVVDAIVRAHGGSVSVTSGERTEFMVRLSRFGSRDSEIG